MDKFIHYDNEEARLIQNASAELYRRLIGIDADQLGMPEHCLHYYKASHSTRLFFSIETSAHLLYKGIRLADKNIEDLVVMDYGAGVGTLFLLAKLLGCKTVVYNDHLEEWKQSAELVADAVNISIDHYIIGDIDHCAEQLDQLRLKCDIITSRNVIEHIYRLDVFFGVLRQRQPVAIVCSSTTANAKNPGAVFKHKMWHAKWEKVYHGKRVNIIRRFAPEMNDELVKILATSTRGLAARELEHAILNYRNTGNLPDPSIHQSNTCDPETGVWAEHLLGTDEYRKLIGEDYYEVIFEPGFWDSHYPKTYKNTAAEMLNTIIRRSIVPMRLAPFIYVIAIPKSKMQ